MKTIEQEWDDFSKFIYKDIKVGKIQYNETKRAFFAGAMFTIQQILNAFDASEFSPDELTNSLVNIDNECREFMRNSIKTHLESN